MRKVLTIVLLSVVFLILDNTLMPLIAIKGVYPSLLFIFIISYSIINGMNEGTAVGILGGALQDVYFCSVFGINTLINMLLCLVAAQIGKSIFKEKSLIPVFAIFALSILKGACVFVMLFLIKQRTYIEISLYRSIYNFVIAIFMYRFIYKISQKKYMKREWRF